MKKFDTKSLVLLAILAGILVLMAFTPIGYLNVGLLSITFNMIPVAIGAVVLGPIGGAVLGAVFGLTSFVQCFGMSAFGTVLCEISFGGAIVVCLVARILAGYLTGLIFKATGKIKNDTVKYSITGFSAAALNTLLFMTSLLLIYGNTDYILEMRGGMNVLAFAAAFVGINAVVEIAVCTVVTGAVAVALKKAKLIENQPIAAKVQ